MTNNKHIELNENKYLSKSLKISKIYWRCLLISFITAIIIKPLFKETYFFIDLIIGIPVLMLIVLAPLGLYYSYRSFKIKESNLNAQLIYFLGHFMFTLLSIFFAYSIYLDLKK